MDNQLYADPSIIQQFRSSGRMNFLGASLALAGIALTGLLEFYQVRIVVTGIGYRSVYYEPYLYLHPVFIVPFFILLAVGMVIINVAGRKRRALVSNYTGRSVRDLTPNEIRQAVLELKSQAKKENKDS